MSQFDVDGDFTRGPRAVGEGSSAPADVLVVAHPDDEILWFAPFVPTAKRILVSFANNPDRPDLLTARQRVRDSHLPQLEFLPLVSARVFRRSNWKNQTFTTYGVRLRRLAGARGRRYRSNFPKLVDLLDSMLTPSDRLFTHNPWGEYGHEEHIQVWRAVQTVAQYKSLDVWIWDGLTSQEQRRFGCLTRARYYPNLPLHLEQEQRVLDTDFYLAVREAYRRAGAWTFEPNYVPPDKLRYLRVMENGVDVLNGTPIRPARTATRVFPARR